MPWFICFEIPPDTALGFHRNRLGLSVIASLSRDEAIANARQALESKGHRNLTLIEAYRYLENEEV